MGVFILGTAPLFLGLGFLTTTLGDTFRSRFFKIAGALVMYLGITTFNSTLVLVGSPITLQIIRDQIPITIDLSGERGTNLSAVTVMNGVQTANITVLPNGYTPNYIQVSSGVPVTLNLTPGYSAVPLET